MTTREEPREINAGDPIVKGHAGGSRWRYDVQERARIVFAEIMIEKKATGGLFRYMEGAGRFNKRVLHVLSQGSRREVPATAEGVKSAVRRVRDAEAAELNAANARIGEIRRQLDAALEEREAIKRRAWDRGWVFTLADARALAEESLTRRAERKADAS